jgi:NhaP-type Na+/H+ or K+/H+ antiporter
MCNEQWYMLNNKAMNVKRYIFRRSILPSLLLASLSYFLSISILTILLKMFYDDNFDVINYACIASVVLVTDSFALQNTIHRLP